MSYVLAVDDEAAFRRLVRTTVEAMGHDVRTASNGEEALALARDHVPALAFVDLRMTPGELDGMATLEGLRALSPDVAVVLVTGYGDVSIAVDAMKAGALDFLQKPVDLDELRRIVVEVLGGASTLDDGGDAVTFGGVAVAPGPFRETIRLLALAADSDAPVLVMGESGTGKELAARFVHEGSPRRGGPFVSVNCAAIPGSLLEAEMFGVAKGAYTGAVAKPGRFEAAHGGTLLLDEIGEMDILLQAKLLRVIQEGELERVGSLETRAVDVRIVATTNRPLRDAIEEGRFREDLYFRLNVFEAVLPPLRARPDDILPLAEHFVRELGQGSPRRLSKEVKERLRAHPWPGNVRELRNAMERATILARGGIIRPSHLPPTIGEATARPPDEVAFKVTAGTTVHDVERELIAKTLEAQGGNRTRTAEALGMSRRALQYKLKRYDLS